MDLIEKINKLFKEDIDQMNNLINSLTYGRSDLIHLMANHLISSGGKRIRPLLTIISAKLCDNRTDRHIKLAAAVEFIHTATLLHDDVVDKSMMRRNRATANKIWGDKASILVGDYLLSQAFRIMVSDGSIRVLDVLSTSSAIIAEGEVMQLVATNDIDITYNRYIEIIKAKTAELFASSCQIGAIITDKLVEDENNLRDFGMNLGIVFQIIDDYLDYFSENNLTGKEIGNDFIECKVTLPIIIAYQKANESEKNFWIENIKNKNQNDNSLDYAINLLTKYRINDIMFNYAKKYSDLAKNLLSNFPDSETKALLIELVDFSLNRLY